MNRKQEIQEQMIVLRHELNDITEKESDKINKKLLGKCFKYRNSYSCPETEDNYWSLYTKVTKIKDGCLFVLRFQIDENGRIEIEPNRFEMAEALTGSHKEIKESEFTAAWNKMINNINSL